MKRIQLRISEEIMAEMTYARRQDTCRSWDEFFRAMLQRRQQQGQQNQPSKLECGARTELEALNQRVKWLETGLERLLSLAENHEEILQTMQQELTESLEVFRRMANLLTRALNEENNRPPGPASSDDPFSPNRRRKLLP